MQSPGRDNTTTIFPTNWINNRRMKGVWKATNIPIKKCSGRSDKVYFITVVLSVYSVQFVALLLTPGDRKYQYFSMLFFLFSRNLTVNCKHKHVLKRKMCFRKNCFFFIIVILKIIVVINSLLKFGAAYFNDRWDLRVDVVIGEMEACSVGTFVQQWVLVKLNLPAGIALVEAHCAVSKVDHFP